MTFFIGIVPPQRIYNEVLNIQKQFGDNRVEPHITLRPPVKPINADEWVNNAEQIIKNHPPITIELTGTAFFGKRVLFISIQSEGIYTLEEQTKNLSVFEQPSKKQNQHEAYHPHLTLGRVSVGFAFNDFLKMKTLADDFLKTGPLIFPVLSARIYHKPSPQSRYQRLKDVAFTGIKTE